MKNKLGICINNLGPSQLNYFLIKSINEYLDSNINTDIIAFYENIQPKCIPTKFALMNIIEAWDYSGTLIATDLSTASKIAKFPSVTRKIFYIWDLEWIRLRQKQFEELRSIYGNPELELVTRSVDYKKIIENCWNVEVKYTIENFEIETLIKEMSIKWTNLK